MHRRHILSSEGKGALTEAQLAAVVSLAADSIIAVDSAQCIIFFNGGAERTFGYEAAEVLGRPLEVLLPEGVRLAHADHVRRFAAAPEAARHMGERLRIAGVRRDGTEFPAEASIAKIGGDDVVFLVVLRDVTEQASARATLAEQQRQLEEAQRIARVGSWEWSVGADAVRWSDELYRIYGLEPGSGPLDFDGFLARVHPEDRGNTRASIEAALAGGETFDFEERIVRPDGSSRRLRSRGAVIRDAAGVPVRLIGVCQDITEQRELEEQALLLAAEQAARAAAEAAEARMAFLARASAELASSLDPTTTLRTVARLAVPAIADWAAVEIAGPDGVLRRLSVEHPDPAGLALLHELETRYPPDPGNPSGAQRVVNSGESFFVPVVTDEMLQAGARDAAHAELLRRLELRSYICVPLTGRTGVLGAITLASSGSGRVYTEQDLLLAEDLGRRAAIAMENARLVAELHEAHERLTAQAQELELQAEELEARNAELQLQAGELARLNRARSDFMATISHELRTPLNAIIGYSDLLRDGVPVPIPETARQQVERIRLGAGHLLHLIEEILTFSSLEAERQKVTAHDVDPRDLVDELHAVIEPLARQRGLDLRLDTARMPARIRTDRHRLRQVLVNLLANAVKFTESGHVELAAYGDGDDVVFDVRDTGVGISADDQRYLFEPFWQADQSHTRRAQGAGLGLAIADRLAGLLGGAITVRSAPGEGSEFRVRLPVEG